MNKHQQSAYSKPCYTVSDFIQNVHAWYDRRGGHLILAGLSVNAGIPSDARYWLVKQGDMVHLNPDCTVGPGDAHDCACVWPMWRCSISFILLTAWNPERPVSIDTWTDTHKRIAQRFYVDALGGIGIGDPFIENDQNGVMQHCRLSLSPDEARGLVVWRWV